MEVVAKKMSLVGLMCLFSSPVVAIEIPKEKTLNAEADLALTESAKPDTAVQAFVADGSPVVMERFGLSIIPPLNWDIKTNAQMSIIMSEPLPETPVVDYEKPRYRRNITVSTIHSPSIVDEARASELKQELMKTFGANTMISEYQILEHTFVDYRGKNDGLVVYASMIAGGFPLMQMHILVSGEEKQFLMTYTDLADRFRAQPELMTEAWNSMLSVTVSGEPSSRYHYLIVGGGSFAMIAAFFGLMGLIRRRRQNSLFQDADSADFSDDESSEWSFDKNDDEIPEVSVF